MPNPPAIDQRAIEALRELSTAGSDDFLREIIALYLQDTPMPLAKIELALADHDLAAISCTARSIKGSSENFGATPLAQLAYEIELAAATTGVTAAAVLALKAEYARVAEALTASVAGHSPGVD